MLRKSLTALMMGVICAGSAMADDTAAKQPKPAATGFVGWFKNKTAGLKSRPSATASKSGSKLTAKAGTKNTGKPSAKAVRPTGGIERAVVADAEHQSINVRQTSGVPQDSTIYVNEQPFPTSNSAPQPVEIQQAPVIPNISTMTGPQYFSAMPAGMSNAIPVHPSGNWQSYEAPMPTYIVSQGQFWNVSNPGSPVGPQNLGSAQTCPPSSGGLYPQSSGTLYSQSTGGQYPHTGAALYPSPQPGIPHQMGGTAIMNQAFHPHEMLYQHRYQAMYPPYYYKVNGGWMVTPFGVWSKEDWHLQGTQVDVKYKSHISPFAHFAPPFHR